MIELHQEDCSNIAVSEKIKDAELNLVNVREDGDYTHIDAIFLGDMFKENVISTLRKEKAFNINLKMKSRSEIWVSYDILTTAAWRNFSSLGCTVVPPLRVANGVEKWFVYTPDEISQRDIKRQLEMDNATHISRIRELTLKSFLKVIFNMDFLSDFIDTMEALTDLQVKTIKQAYVNGYYDYPRRCTLGDLAKINGISKNAMAKRLKSVEKKIFECLFGYI
ncbi:helix-turn-helix domain-containing protein [Archaeoglobus sp.]|nr:helix-turn-helix domain-containing protein [Archaeoglobus sp.]KUJ93898.1 MAG: hypothetical protein XD40_0932 [Archaeoglobus fulgidus]KUK07261.1 MAG: hypothetical protein XD48_0524 [Archaeoglobus fulgidus]MDI3498429.1 hypothetical protein [Archaeoglobus sp.]